MLLSGAAYVFVTYDGGFTWTQKQKLLASNGLSGDFFGSAVCIYENAIVVGAYQDNNVAGHAGEIKI